VNEWSADSPYWVARDPGWLFSGRVSPTPQGVAGVDGALGLVT